VPFRHVAERFCHPLFAFRLGGFHDTALANRREEFVASPVECGGFTPNAALASLPRQSLPPSGTMVKVRGEFAAFWKRSR
jgi:hypothetical protein